MAMSFFDDPALGAVFVFSTRRDTQKYENLRANPRVSILSHDFAPRGGEAAAGGGDERLSGSLSITCQGTVRVLEGAEEERLRLEHLRRQPPHYSHFISGPNIAVVVVAPEVAQAVGEGDRVERLGPF
jgi:hypothetical protein